MFAAVAYGIWHNGLISLAIMVASIPLPWIAVLIANDRPPRRAEEPRRFDNARRRIPLFPTAERPALESGPPRPRRNREPGQPPRFPTEDFWPDSQRILRSSPHFRRSGSVNRHTSGTLCGSGRCTS